MKKRTLILGLALMMTTIYAPCFLNAQDLNPYNNIIPPNPDAASLAKYADFPVELSSGLVQIGIPLWNIKCGDINVPVSLSYHASGIPVAETSSYVGLGWTLNAGGAITRTIRGIADDGMDTYSSEVPGILTWYPNYAINPNSSEDYANPTKYHEAGVGKRDLEPDMFYYNFCNFSGKFVFDFNGTPHLIPRKNILIEKEQNSSPTSPRRIIKWKITTDDGLKYYFEEFEKTKQDTKTETRLNDAASLKTGSLLNNSLTTSEHNSAWFLTKIEMPNSTESIIFEYDDITLENTYPVSETYKVFVSAAGGGPLYNSENGIHEETQTKSTITGKRLSKIIAPDQTVEFIAGNYRYDLKGDQVLDKVLVKDEKGEIIKQFKLTYNYFSSNGMTTLGTADPDADPNTSLRLSLKMIQELDKNGNSLPPHTFEYENSVWLPDRLTSKAQDHWGYYNGEEDNTTLIPDLNSTMNLASIRDASGDNMKAGSLVRINYPTGGYTQFNHEANFYTTGTSKTWEKINAYCEVGACVYNNTDNTFTIEDASQKATIKVKLSGNYNGSYTCGSCNSTLIDPANPMTYIYLAIEGPNETIRFPQEFAINGIATGTINMEEPRTLTNGTYKVKAQKTSDGVNFYDINSCDASPYYTIKFSVEGLQQKAYYGPIAVGGLRIKEKIDYDPVSNKSHFKQYDYDLGIVDYTPAYSYITSVQNTTYNTHTSSSNSALNNGGEGVISYEKVTVIEGNDAIGINGKTENEYTKLQSFNSYPTYIDCNAYTHCLTDKVTVQISMPVTNEFPFCPVISGAWGSGLLKSQSIYKYKNNSYSKIKEIQNTYKNDYWGNTNSYNSETDVMAAKVGVISSGDYAIGSDEFGVYRSAVQFYFIPSRNMNLIKTTETDYDDNEVATISKVTDIEYDNFSPYIYPSKTTHALSDGNQLVEQTLYPQDYTNEGNDFIGLMKTNNIINKPIEKITYKIEGSNTLVTGGGLFTYKADDNIGRPDKIFKLQTEAPISKTNFKLSNKTTTNALSFDEGTNTSFSLGGIDSRYTAEPAITCDAYDEYGNSAQITTKSGITSYIWGYNGRYPIAKIENATYADIKESFNSIYIGYTPGWNALTTGSFVSNNSPGSTVYSHLDDSGYRYYLNLIRANFPKAIVTTYTYKPLVGMTSSTDANSKTTYYEYDDVSHLKYIKDNDSSILKSYDYHYKEQ